MTVEQSSSEKEIPVGGVMGQVFLEPEPAETKVKTIEESVAVQFRTTDTRLLTLKVIMEPREVRQLVDELEKHL
jgi:hypothetical protein